MVDGSYRQLGPLPGPESEGDTMIDSVGSTLSALSGYRKKMDVTANNIANVNTDEFKKSRVTFQEAKQGGVEPVVDQVDTPGHIKETYRDDHVVEIEASNVDIAEEFPEMLETKSGYSANLKTFKAKDEMMGSLLDIFS